MKTPIDILKKYVTLLNNKNLTVNSKRKEIEKEIKKIEDIYTFVDKKWHCILTRILLTLSDFIFMPFIFVNTFSIK